MTSDIPDTRTRTRGPSDTSAMVGGLGGLGFVVFFLVGAIVSNVAATDTYPRPDAAAAEVLAYFAENQGVTGFLSLTQAAGAVALLLFTGAVVGSARRWLPVGSAEPSWAAVGGAVAAAFLMLSGLLAWALGRDEVVDSPPGTVALHQLVFAAGGVGHVAPLGVLVGACALAAMRHRAHAGWLAVVGLVAAALSMLSLVTLLVLGPAVALIPLGRFTAFFYVVAVSVLLLSGRLAPAGE
jgi:hypothetical protein